MFAAFGFHLKIWCSCGLQTGHNAQAADADDAVVAAVLYT